MNRIRDMVRPTIPFGRALPRVAAPMNRSRPRGRHVKVPEQLGRLSCRRRYVRQTVEEPEEEEEEEVASAGQQRRGRRVRGDVHWATLPGRHRGVPARERCRSRR